MRRTNLSNLHIGYKPEEGLKDFTFTSPQKALKSVISISTKILQLLQLTAIFRYLVYIFTSKINKKEVRRLSAFTSMNVSPQACPVP